MTGRISRIWFFALTNFISFFKLSFAINPSLHYISISISLGTLFQSLFINNLLRFLTQIRFISKNIFIFIFYLFTLVIQIFLFFHLPCIYIFQKRVEITMRFLTLQITIIWVWRTMMVRCCFLLNYVSTRLLVFRII